MPFHLTANFVALANVANTDVPALNDDVLYRQNSHFVPDVDCDLMAAYASAVTLTAARLNNPKTRQITPAYLVPIGTTLLPITRPQVVDYRMRPFRLRAQEEIVWEATDSAAGPNNLYLINWLGFGNSPAPNGDIYGLRGTSTTAAVASTWTTVDVAWQNTLPAGEYSVIGASYTATNAVAFSLIFYDQFWRPGGLGKAAAGIAEWEPQLWGGLGEWGRFTTITLPRLRVLNDSTDNAHTFILNCVRLR